MKQRDSLLADLHSVQDQSGQQYLPEQGLRALAKDYQLTEAALRGTASYYSMFSLQPRGRHIIRFCQSPVCRLTGSADLLAVAAELLGLPQPHYEPGHSGQLIGTSTDGSFSLETCHCLGRCAGAPAMLVDDKLYTGLSPELLGEIIDDWRQADHRGGPPPEPRPGWPSRRAANLGPAWAGPAVSLRYAGLATPTDCAAYRQAGGYRALELALQHEPQDLIELFTQAGLRGRGGAGFPTGLKERSTAGAACLDGPDCERYVICNADEGEPGTFKDRIIIESSPQLLLEGMVISAYAIGARRGYIYIRGEYHQAIQSLRAAIASAYASGYLGERLLGSAFSFDLEIRLGAGSYLCGEELTLIESLEGKRGYPRIKPPFPAQSGLWGKPTLVNNVETLAALPWVVEFGPPAYLGLGLDKAAGSKLFCVSGDVARPGYGEWPLGIDLETILAAAGGCVNAGGQACHPQAILLGGAAGCFVDRTDLCMDYDSLRQAGASLGSGAVIVLGQGRSVLACLADILDFFKHESCGKCIPCRVGTSRLAMAGRALATRAAFGADQDELRTGLAGLCADAEHIAKTSLCPLGQSPILPLRSAMQNLKQLT